MELGRSISTISNGHVYYNRSDREVLRVTTADTRPSKVGKIFAKELRWKNISPTAAAGAILLIVAGVFHVIGLVSPHWTNITSFTDDLQPLVSYQGLWSICDESPIVAMECVTLTGDEVSAWLRAVRAMVMLSLVFGAIGLTGSMGILLGIPGNERIKVTCKISTIAACFLACICTTAGVAVYGAKYTATSAYGDVIDTSFPIPAEEHRLSWAFALCCCGGVISLFCGAIQIL